MSVGEQQCGEESRGGLIPICEAIPCILWQLFQLPILGLELRGRGQSLLPGTREQVSLIHDDCCLFLKDFIYLFLDRG